MKEICVVDSAKVFWFRVAKNLGSFTFTLNCTLGSFTFTLKSTTTGPVETHRGMCRQKT
jgi:hypothetical protein